MDDAAAVSMLQAVLPHVSVEILREQVRIHGGDAQAAFHAAFMSAAPRPSAAPHLAPFPALAPFHSMQAAGEVETVDLEVDAAVAMDDPYMPAATAPQQPSVPEAVVDIDDEISGLERSASDYDCQLDVMRGVLPEADEEFLKKTLTEAGGNAERALARVLERGDDDYPKRPRPSRATASSSSSAPAPQAEERAKEPEHSFDAQAYTSKKKNAPSKSYVAEAKKQLEIEFPEFSPATVHKEYAKHRSLFTIAWRSLYDATTNLLNDKPLPPWLRPTKKRRKRPPPSEPLKSRRLKGEIDFVHAWRRQQEEDASRSAALTLYRDQCVANGEVLNCECCFTDEIHDQMVQCNEGHLFCSECVSSYVTAQLGEGSGESLLRLRCMSTSGCTEELPPSELKRALPPKLLESYRTRLEKASVEQALGGGIEQCPFCDYAMEMEMSPEENRVFVCQAEDCGKESCRLCHEEAHLPLRCDEVKSKRVVDDHRLTVEERMSSALIRECKPCRERGVASRFVKESGCNKMTCPKCKGWTCYNCSEAIEKKVSYGHFCQHPTEPGQPCTKCKKCPLWSPPNLEKEEMERVRVAALAADNEYRQNHEAEASSGVLEELAIMRESREANERPKKRRRHDAGRRDAQHQGPAG